MTEGDRMPVSGSGSSHEPVYWRSADGAIEASVTPGPPQRVMVTSTGIKLYDPGTSSWVNVRTAGAARWLGLRLIEAATIWEREVNKERT